MKTWEMKKTVMNYVSRTVAERGSCVRLKKVIWDAK